MPSKVCDEIIYPPPNSSGCTVRFWEWISNSIHIIVLDINYATSILFQLAAHIDLINIDEYAIVHNQ